MKTIEHLKQTAAELAASQEDLARLTREAAAKAEGLRAVGSTLVRDLRMLLRLVDAYAAGRYRAVPWATLVAATFALLYFLTPLDLVPDMLPGVGLADDASIVALVLATIQSDLSRFEAWEQRGR